MRLGREVEGERNGLSRKGKVFKKMLLLLLLLDWEVGFRDSWQKK